MQTLNLFLWRHAEAEDSMPDLERPLTARGRRDAARVAKALSRLLSADSRLLASPAVRTRETAAPLVERASLTLEIEPRLAPGAPPDGVLATLRSAIDALDGDTPSLVVVGHQPWVGQVARHLLTGGHGDWSVKKAAVWWLVRRSRGGEAEWTLRSVIDPELVRAVSSGGRSTEVEGNP